MSSRVPITVRVEQFEGPMDLLLFLIQTHELDISRISLARITDQYLAFVKLMQALNFDTASEFLVMAATLVHWKSKALLPKEEDPNAVTDADDDVITEEELLRRLREHQRFLAAGALLGERPLLGDEIFIRSNPKPPIEKQWKEMNITQLAMGFQDMLVRARKRVRILKKETVSLTDKIVEFGAKLEVGRLIEMRSLVSALGSRPEVVVTFLASLELSRLRKLRVHQEGTYQPIYLELLRRIEAQDLSVATGFDAPADEASVPSHLIQEGAIASMEASLRSSATP